MRNSLHLVSNMPLIRQTLAILRLPFVLLRIVVQAVLVLLSSLYHRMQAAFFLRVSQGLAAVRGDAHSLCIFAHYDEHKAVADYVVHYVSQLHAAGCDIVFVSTSKLPSAEVEKLSAYCLQIITRPNWGYDFGSYRTGYGAATAMLENYDRVIFANDSVYAPIRPLTDFFAKLSKLDYDIIGATDSWEHCYHAQSYFLSVNAKTAVSKEFCSFLSSINYFPLSKWVVIFSGEVALTKRLRKKGVTVGAVYPYSYVKRAFLANDGDRNVSNSSPASKFVNPSHYFWATLVEEFDCPFLKIELLRSNPVGIPVSSQWIDLVSQSGNYDPELILEHLKRVNAVGGAL